MSKSIPLISRLKENFNHFNAIIQNYEKTSFTKKNCNIIRFSKKDSPYVMDFNFYNSSLPIKEQYCIISLTSYDETITTTQLNIQDMRDLFQKFFLDFFHNYSFIHYQKKIDQYLFEIYLPLIKKIFFNVKSDYNKNSFLLKEISSEDSIQKQNYNNILKEKEISDSNRKEEEKKRSKKNKIKELEEELIRLKEEENALNIELNEKYNTEYFSETLRTRNHESLNAFSNELCDIIKFAEKEKIVDFDIKKIYEKVEKRYF